MAILHTTNYNEPSRDGWHALHLLFSYWQCFQLVCMDFLALLVITHLHVCWAVLAFLALCYSCASYSALARDLSRRLFCSFCSSCYLPFHCGLNLGLFTHLVYVPSLGRNILENIRCRHFVFFRLNLCKLGLVISLDGTEPIQDKSPVFGRLLLWEVHLNARSFAKNPFMTW